MKNILIFFLVLNTFLYSGGNTNHEDFNTATRHLLEKVYIKGKIEKKTLYCQATFNKNKKIIDFNGFQTSSYHNRFNKLEWEHVVPAKKFGNSFPEWRNSNQMCENKGGRDCAKSLSMPFRLIYSDLYNIYPAIGALNAIRRDHPFVEGDASISKYTLAKSYFKEDGKLDFGSCPIIIKDKKVIPPNYSKGIIARAYLYMDKVYPKFKLSRTEKQLFKKWNKIYPANEDECRRTKAIKNIQGNKNEIVIKSCKDNGLSKLVRP